MARNRGSIRGKEIDKKKMPGTFAEQFKLVDPVLSLTLGKDRQLTICTGSGISRGRMPMLARLVARAFCSTPAPKGLEALYDYYSEHHMFAERVRPEIDYDVPKPGLTTRS